MNCHIIKNALLKIPCSVAMVNVQAIFGVFTNFILGALNLLWPSRRFGHRWLSYVPYLTQAREIIVNRTSSKPNTS